MTGKKKRVDFSVRPRAIKESLPANADQWVQAGGEANSPPQTPHPIKQKRLTLNLPASQHTAFKGRCVLEGITIQDKVQALIDAYLATERPTVPEEGGNPFDSGRHIVLGSPAIHSHDGSVMHTIRIRDTGAAQPRPQRHQLND